MTASMHRVLAALNLPTTVPELIIRATAIVDATASSAWFPSPQPPLDKVRAAIDALSKAEAERLLTTRGGAGPRNLARKKVVDLLTRLKHYVQGIANDNPGFEVTIIKSAGMDVVERHPPVKIEFDVLEGPVSGSVRLVARAVAKEAQYLWELSTDGGKTWVRIRMTTQANTTVKDLEPGKRYGFRFRAVTARFTTNWCNPVFYVVQ